MAQFNPNQNSLAGCIEKIQEMQKELGVSGKEILTSRDKNYQNMMKALHVDNVPSGFNKWMLPFYTTGEATFYLSFGAPNVEVPEHSHDEGAGIRFIMSGSIVYNEQELSSGDWMYLPAGAKYSFKVGPMGVGMCYCYQCCCA